MLAFAAATLLSALLSAQPPESLIASNGLLLMAALLRDRRCSGRVGRARGGSSRLLSAVAAIAAGIGLLQVAVCPGPGVDAGTPALALPRCHRARGLFSIYMTLAGMLTLMLLATAAASLAGRAAPPWFVPLWLVMLGGLIASYTRGAWLGFAAGVLALLPASRRGRAHPRGRLAALVLGLLAGPPGLRHRFVSMGDPEEATVKERALHVARAGS